MKFFVIFLQQQKCVIAAARMLQILHECVDSLPYAYDHCPCSDICIGRIAYNTKSMEKCSDDNSSILTLATDYCNDLAGIK